ncbi:MAG: type III-B CRISPR module RAMP protein Cmr1 [Blastocatellia bacterium]
MELLLKTLTPLWTGGPDAGKVDRLHETGILGSLRWWTEVLVRGVGGLVSDPTQGDRNGLDMDIYDKTRSADRAHLIEAGLCDVSQIFGATGWRRRFRLDVHDRTSPAKGFAPEIKAQRSYRDKDGQLRTPTWYFRDQPRAGQFSLNIQSLASDFSPTIMAGLVQFLADWAAIGARPQMGFGVIEPVNGRIETRDLYNWIACRVGDEQYLTLPSLRNIFLARVVKPGASDQETFNLKYDLRQLFRSDGTLRHFVMGTVEGERMASKVKISCPYGDGVIRLWGWLPEQSRQYNGGWTRDRVVQAIYDFVKPNVQVWREMNSARDSVAPDCGDALAFLSDLLGLKEVSDAA